MAGTKDWILQYVDCRADSDDEARDNEEELDLPKSEEVDEKFDPVCM